MAVLTLDDSGNLIRQLYTANLNPIAPGASRLEVINATSDSLVGTLSGVGNIPLPPNSLQQVDIGSGSYTTTIISTSNNVVVGPVNVELAQGANSYIYVLAGAVSTGSTQLIGPAIIRGVF